MYSEIEKRMEYIQKVFLGVQDYMQGNPGPDDLLVFLNSEPPEFRSVAYESASMAVGLRDLMRRNGLQEWQALYKRSCKAHSFHLEIGLGWAFAKIEMPPDTHLDFMLPYMRAMVFDGIGYYNGLFRGRRTVRNCEVPEYVPEQGLPGFDHGLGRRLWYISRGDVPEVSRLVASFPASRRADLWRGVGIACGYVGGCGEVELENLAVASGYWRTYLKTGIEWAAISRNASGSMNHYIETACRIICKTPVSEMNLTLPS